MIQIIYHGTVQKEMLKPEYQSILIKQISDNITRAMETCGLEFANIHVANSPFLPEDRAQMSVLVNVLDMKELPPEFNVKRSSN